MIFTQLTNAWAPVTVQLVARSAGADLIGRSLTADVLTATIIQTAWRSCIRCKWYIIVWRLVQCHTQSIILHFKPEIQYISITAPSIQYSSTCGYDCFRVFGKAHRQAKIGLPLSVYITTQWHRKQLGGSNGKKLTVQLDNSSAPAPGAEPSPSYATTAT